MVWHELWLGWVKRHFPRTPAPEIIFGYMHQMLQNLTYTIEYCSVYSNAIHVFIYETYHTSIYIQDSRRHT